MPTAGTTRISCDSNENEWVAKEEDAQTKRKGQCVASPHYDTKLKWTITPLMLRSFCSKESTP